MENNLRKTLTFGFEQTFTIPSGGNSPVLTIESDRLVAGQQIQFEANL